MFQGMELVLFLADLLAITLTGERFFDALLFARLQIKRVRSEEHTSELQSL